MSNVTPISAARPPDWQTEPLLSPADVAKILRVDPKTVTRWARAGKLRCFRTPGGHRRYFECDIRALLDGTEGGPS